jgi:putative heme-binding domain-containing protein
VPPALAAQLRSHDDPAIAALAQRSLAPSTPATRPDHATTIDRIRKVIASGPGDPYKGEPIFMQRCAVCHTLFFKGGRIGPDLTSYQRDDPGTLLTSLIDPNAEIREGFVNQSVSTKDGRTLTGFVSQSDAAVVTIRGLDGQDIAIPRAEVRDMRPTGLSLMPEGLLDGLSDAELRDFFAYLRIPQPITR